MTWKNNQEPSNIQEDEFLGDSIEKTLKGLVIPLEGLKNLKKLFIVAPPKNFIHVVMLLYLLHQAHQWIFNMWKREEIPKEGDNCI
jgi:hypothetical protein